MGTIAALPENLDELGSQGIKQAISARRERLTALFEKRNTDDLGASEVVEAKRLNDDVDRLVEFSEQVQPHPGHSAGRGGTASPGQSHGPEFGRSTASAPSS